MPQFLPLFVRIMVTQCPQSMRIVLLGPLIILIVMQLFLDLSFILRYNVHPTLQLLDLVSDQALTLLRYLNLPQLLVIFIFNSRHVFLQVLLEGFVVDEDAVLQAGKLIDKRKQVFVHELLAVVELDDVIQLRAGHEPIMVLVDFFDC